MLGERWDFLCGLVTELNINIVLKVMYLIP